MGDTLSTINGLAQKNRPEINLESETRFHSILKRVLSSARRREDQMMTNFKKLLV
jgi:hypothetical protein